MPTAPKLIAAIIFGLFAYFVADLVKPLLPEGTQTHWMNETCAFFGLIMGWNMSGRRAGDGLRAGFGYGLTTVALATFWSIFAFAFTEMLSNSLDHRYRGPMQALKAMVGFILEYGVLIATSTIIATLVIGGLFGGWVIEWVAKRWP